MAIVVQFIGEYAPWVYGVCALVALWYLRVAILARAERKYAMFALEREAATNRIYGAWTVAISLLLVIGVVYFLSTVVSEAVEPFVEDLTTPTPVVVVQATPPGPTPTLPDFEQLLSSPTPTPTPAMPTPMPTATAAPAATTSPVASAPLVSVPRCSDPRASITSPGLNAEVSGMVPIMGTASHDQLKYYKLEVGTGADPGVWSYFDGGERSVRNGTLGVLNADALAPGVYSIRVLVVDITGNYPTPCQTVVSVK